MATATPSQIKSNQTVSPVQAIAITSLLAGDTVTKAAEIAGVHRSTLNRWLGNATFRHTLENTQREHVVAFQCKLHTMTHHALAAIKQILADPKASASASPWHHSLSQAR